ncbi:MAG: hypothetical protein ACTSUN_10805 [Promethearchaeota archaeon]
MNQIFFLFGENLETFAHTIGDIIEFLIPILIPLGTVLSAIMDTLANILPYGNLTLYIILFISFIILGMIINIKWPGNDKKLNEERKRIYSMKYSLDDTLDKQKELEEE